MSIKNICMYIYIYYIHTQCSYGYLTYNPGH